MVALGIGNPKSKPNLGLWQLLEGDDGGGDGHHHPLRGASLLVDVVQGGASGHGGQESCEDEQVHLCPAGDLTHTQTLSFSLCNVVCWIEDRRTEITNQKDNHKTRRCTFALLVISPTPKLSLSLSVMWSAGYDRRTEITNQQDNYKTSRCILALLVISPQHPQSLSLCNQTILWSPGVSAKKGWKSLFS